MHADVMRARKTNPSGLRSAHGTEPAMGKDALMRGSMAAACVVLHPPPLKPAMNTSAYPFAFEHEASKQAAQPDAEGGWMRGEREGGREGREVKEGGR